MKMTNRELDIIGQAYQNAYDELVEDLKWIGKSQSDVCTIANTWQWFKVEKLDGCMPNGKREKIPTVQCKKKFRFSNGFPSLNFKPIRKFQISEPYQVPIFKPISCFDFQTDFQIFKLI